MMEIDLKPRAKKYIDSLPPKHKRQIKESILSLQNNPMPHDAKRLIGYENYIRVDVGEYRIIYRYEEEAYLVTVVLIGRRNDDTVYKVAKRILR